MSSVYAGAFHGLAATENRGAAFYINDQLACPALTCVNPACPAHGKGDHGAPFLFVREFQGVKQSPAGEIIWPRSPGVKQKVRCPACKQSGWVRPFILPSAARKMEELQQELQSALAAYEEARKRGQPKAEGYRTPWEINQEMNKVAQLYLVRIPK